jgi:hypothetical protein
MATLEQKEYLIKEIRGIQRIVINNCYGGFGLSNEAVLRYLELSGIPVWNEMGSSKIMGFKYWLVPPGPERITDVSGEDWHNMTLPERQAHNQKYDSQIFNERDIARDDPYLVQVVEEMGSKANGSHADLKVVEVPGDVDWIIEEYDGNEWVAEKHRKWS